MIHVEVTEQDIRNGIAADCYACPAATALVRATNEECAIVRIDWTLYIRVGYRHMEAPDRVWRFVEAFDDLDGAEMENRLFPFRPQVPAVLEEDLAPFTFEIPDLASEEWHEACAHCEILFASDELDDEGLCPECKGKLNDE